MAYYDAPASVDHILNTTGLKTISWVGISMGNGITMAFLSSRPEYNDKIDIWFAMAAALTLKNTRYLQVLIVLKTRTLQKLQSSNQNNFLYCLFTTDTQGMPRVY